MTENTMGLGFDKSQRLLRREDFLLVQREGRRSHAAHFVVITRPRGEDPHALTAPRLGLVTSRKVGPAVLRNRVRRVLREFFRLNQGLFPMGNDVVILAKEAFPRSLASPDIRDEIHAALTRRRGPAPRGPAAPPSRSPTS